MQKINIYLFINSIKYIFINLTIILILVIFLNFIELSREVKNKSIYDFIFLSLLKIPSIINQTSPFVIIISTAFLFRYLINNNELISMRNIGFSIFDIFKPITVGVFLYGFAILIFLNPISAIFETKYNNILKNNDDNMYSINISKNSLWIKNISFKNNIFFINIEEFDIKKMFAEKIKILIIDDEGNKFIKANTGKINDKVLSLKEVNYFDIKNNDYFFKEKIDLKLNFSKRNIIDSVVDYKNIAYYSFLEHTKTLKKFNLYSPEISLYYLSEIFKPFFLIILSFVVMGFSAKFKRNENFFKILFFSVLIGFIFFFLKEIINKITLTFNINFIYSYLIIFFIPLLLGIYKVLQIEND